MGGSQIGLQEIRWLFNMVSFQHGAKVTLIQLSDFLREWSDLAGDIQELFREEGRARNRDKTQLKKLTQISEMVEENGAAFSKLVEDLQSQQIRQWKKDMVVKTHHPGAHSMPSGPGSTAARSVATTAKDQKI